MMSDCRVLSTWKKGSRCHLAGSRSTRCRVRKRFKGVQQSAAGYRMVIWWDMMGPWETMNLSCWQCIRFKGPLQRRWQSLTWVHYCEFAKFLLSLLVCDHVEWQFQCVQVTHLTQTVRRYLWPCLTCAGGGAALATLCNSQWNTMEPKKDKHSEI